MEEFDGQEMSMLLILNKCFMPQVFFRMFTAHPPVNFMKMTSLLIAGFLLSTGLLAGCSGLVRPEPEAGPASLRTYRSEIADAKAKALYAYSQFRLYGSDDSWEQALDALSRAIQLDPESAYLKLLLARAYLHEKRTAEAISVVDALLSREPDNTEALQLRGDIANLEKDDAVAESYYQKIVTRGNADSEVLFRLAMVLSRQKKNTRAAAILEELLANDPEADVARLALARIYADLGYWDKAERQYLTVIDANPRQIQAVLEYGRLLEDSAPERALALYRSFLQDNPRAIMVRQRLAQLYIEQGQVEDALAELQELRWQTPDNLQVTGQIGLLQLELNNWQAAELEFRSLLGKAGHQQRYRYYLAMALAGQERIAEAIAELEKFSPGADLFAPAVLQLAYLHKSRGDEERAIEVLTRAIAEGAEGAESYYYLVALLGDRQEYPAAMRYALEGGKKHPQDVRLLYQLGVLYEKQQRREDAVAVMEQILTIDENHADALNFLAYHQAEAGNDLDQALDRAQRALAIQPSGYIIDTLGWIYFKQGRYEESRAKLEEAGRLHPDDPVITEHLGDLYMAMKLWDQAAAAYRKVLELDPEAEGVAEKLNQAEEHR